MRLLPAIVILGLLLLPAGGCRGPELRLFEKKVPEPLTVDGEVRYAWATAANWIANDYQAGHPEPDEGIQVSSALATSLGPPPETVEDYEKALEELKRANRILQSRLAIVNGFLRQTQGKTVEGTGVNVLGFTGSYWFYLCLVILFVALGGGPIVISAFSLLRNTVLRTTKAIEEWRAEDPEGVARYEQFASRRMDEPHKRIIRQEKNRWMRGERHLRIKAGLPPNPIPPAPPAPPQPVAEGPVSPTYVRG